MSDRNYHEKPDMLSLELLRRKAEQNQHKPVEQCIVVEELDYCSIECEETLALLGSLMVE